MLDILILGVLRRGPVHGYELKHRVQRPTLRTLSNNSLYPLLRRFETAGAVTKQVQTTEGRPPRHMYAITAAGRALFHELITTLGPEEAGEDEAFLVRVGFFAEVTLTERAGVLLARDTALADQQAQAQELLDAWPGAGGWRPLAMRHLLDRLAHDRAFVADLLERSEAEAGADRGSDAPR